ncbi:Glyoxylase, beta-lactamase superfamily II [Anaerosphaera aminiphila DSM 21120]|uniref:Glyoxylase, beta-lactamase superfamily II n=1 Tax=Anaerosphaera aminiphila DSM 21120 TaxID=1120995 RepID=A0A1M5UUP8_9FIRM|nr:MBL fold metallo-hydrolase [Anaerosphaera aminiphila]SHH66732.1 Glyoxylase, beta-lactamase superfamily II [Anaerosphaera aminiphila DSM 21120]
MDFKILRLILGDYQVNCYIVFDEENNAVIIDPGAEANKIIKAVKEHNLNVKYIILTHAHPDHFGALDEVRREFKVKAYLSEDDSEMLANRSSQINGMLGLDTPPLKADILVNDGDLIEFRDKNFKVIATPGHTPGGICLLLDNVLFSGDTLFYGSIGRTDLPGGDYDTIIKSLHKLMELDKDTIVLPGHGSETNIEFERANNPFLK